jgi:hypothetical protein
MQKPAYHQGPARKRAPGVVRLLLAGFAGMLTACGTQNQMAIEDVAASLENGIIAGQKSKAEDYPATGVILFTTERWDGSKVASMLCSGTLIKPDVVLAAGHCNLALLVESDKPIQYFFSLALDVSKFGPTFSGKLPKHTVPVLEIVSHPEFALENVDLGLGNAKDIALLYLDEPITDVEPAKLILASEADELVPGADVGIVGYGRRHVVSLGRRDVGVKYQGNSTISEVGPYEMQIGSGSPDAHKCHGDSGGPTYMNLPSGDDVLVGITSHAYDRGDCWHGGVDTRVDPYLDWIDETLRVDCESGRRPTCSTTGAGYYLN